MEAGVGVELVSVVTKASARMRGLKKGKRVYAVIKASDVMIATGYVARRAGRSQARDETGPTGLPATLGRRVLPGPDFR